MSQRPLKTFRPYEPNQLLLLPPSLHDWLPEGHLAYFVSEIVDSLNLSGIVSDYQGEGRGYPPYDPRMMVKVWVYAYCVGVPSSRKLAQRLVEDVAFRVLAANNWPDFRTLAAFRKRHLGELSGLFDQMLKLCVKAGIVKLGHVAIDGTKLEANASKHKAMSYGRMKKEEERLQADVKRFLEESERIDAEEDAKFGGDRSGTELPEDLCRRETRRKKIKEAIAELEREAKERDQAKLEMDEKYEGRGKPGRKRKHEAGVPKDKAQYNFTDPESRIMKSSQHGFVQAYNAQIAVDSEAQVIVATDLTNIAVDRRHAKHMTDAVVRNVGRPKKATLDAGYWSAENAEHIAAQEIDAYIATGRRRHGEKIAPAPRGRIPKETTPTERMARKLSTKEGAATYARRKAIVEPVFGQIKAARGFRRTLFRGVERVKAEWRLICATHNLLKLFWAQAT